jgi:hypothetical protein
MQQQKILISLTFLFDKKYIMLLSFKMAFKADKEHVCIFPSESTNANHMVGGFVSCIHIGTK